MLKLRVNTGKRSYTDKEHNMRPITQPRSSPLFSVLPYVGQERPAGRHSIAFWVVAYAFTVTMAFSAAPTPLYVLYEQHDHFGSLMGARHIFARQEKEEGKRGRIEA
jgi:hypothetical protein